MQAAVWQAAARRPSGVAEGGQSGRTAGTFSMWKTLKSIIFAYVGQYIALYLFRLSEISSKSTKVEAENPPFRGVGIGGKIEILSTIDLCRKLICSCLSENCNFMSLCCWNPRTTLGIVTCDFKNKSKPDWIQTQSSTFTAMASDTKSQNWSYQCECECVWQLRLLFGRRIEMPARVCLRPVTSDDNAALSVLLWCSCNHG